MGTHAGPIETFFHKVWKKVRLCCSEVRTESHITDRQNDPTAKTTELNKPQLSRYAKLFTTLIGKQYG